MTRKQLQQRRRACGTRRYRKIRATFPQYSARGARWKKVKPAKQRAKNTPDALQDSVWNNGGMTSAAIAAMMAAARRR